MASRIEKLKSHLCTLLRRFLRFSKASFFLSGLVFGNAVAEYSFLGFLIVFIRENLKWDSLWYEALVSTARDCFSAFLASFLAYTTHQRIRPLIMILVNHAIFIAGMLILLFHHKHSILIFLALALLSVDQSAEEYMNEFLTDQLAVNQSEQIIDQLAINQSEQIMDQLPANQSKQVIDQLAINQSEQVIDDAKKTNNRIDAWRFIARFAGAVIGGVLISNLPTSKQLYIPAILVGIGCILVYSYSICYEVSSGDHDGEKHELRPLLKLLPLWTPFLIYYVVDAVGSAFFDYEARLYIIQKSSGIVVSRLIDYIITKFCSKVSQQVQQRIRLAKISFGMLVCFLLCIDTWHVQAKRKSEGSFTFTLQFILLGIMKEMVKEMLGEYFCDQVPDQSMHHLEFTFNSFVEGMGRLLAVVCILVFRNWIGETVDKSHLDNYFRTLAFMSLCALLMFVYLSNTCYWKKEAEDHDDHLEKLEEGSLSPAALPNLESSRSSLNRNYWSIVKGYQRCHGFLKYIKERLGAKEKSS